MARPGFLALLRSRESPTWTFAAAAAVVDDSGNFHLLEPAQLEEVRRTLQVRFADPEALTLELIRRGWLTRYQADQLLQGRAAELILGSYVLLEPLGEGGMGQVFKALQRKLGRTYAVKVVHAERLSSPDALRRFHREIRAAAQLSHPNVVHAVDAGEDGRRSTSSPWKSSPAATSRISSRTAARCRPPRRAS